LSENLYLLTVPIEMTVYMKPEAVLSW